MANGRWRTENQPAATMHSQWLQYLAGGLTAGAIYALVALGYSIIYNASRAINFAQGEFVMIGGMCAVTLVDAGTPLALALPLAVLAAVVVGLVLEKVAIEPARKADTVTLIIITIGAALLLRGLAQLVWDKRVHALPAFTGDQPLHLLGATVLPQSLWVLGGAGVAVVGLSWFFGRTLFGKAMLATSYNPLAAQLVGISTRRVLFVSFGLASALGALAGVLTAPITFTSYDTGIMLGLKGFAAAMLGGLGSFGGAVLGGLVLGLAEALGAGFVSSAYKDAIAFVVILAVLFFMPGGLLGARRSDRV
jgi:branched-chain amino acid transport system permease protein